MPPVVKNMAARGKRSLIFFGGLLLVLTTAVFLSRSPDPQPQAPFPRMPEPVMRPAEPVDIDALVSREQPCIKNSDCVLIHAYTCFATAVSLKHKATLDELRAALPRFFIKHSNGPCPAMVENGFLFPVCRSNRCAVARVSDSSLEYEDYVLPEPVSPAFEAAKRRFEANGH